MNFKNTALQGLRPFEQPNRNRRTNSAKPCALGAHWFWTGIGQQNYHLISAYIRACMKA
jgi:hypothetical protein